MQSWGSDAKMLTEDEFWPLAHEKKKTFKEVMAEKSKGNIPDHLFADILKSTFKLN